MRSITYFLKEYFMLWAILAGVLLMMLMRFGLEVYDNSHISNKYEYFKSTRRCRIPTTKVEFICGASKFKAYTMQHATAGIASMWYMTEDGRQIYETGNCAVIVLSRLPSFRKGEELNPFQLKHRSCP